MIEKEFMQRIAITSPLIPSTQPSTRESLISIVGFHRGMNCSQLTKLVCKARNNQITQQAVFKILKELVEDNILIKDEKRYSVNLNWVREMQKTLKEMEHNCTKREDGKVILLL